MSRFIRSALFPILIVIIVAMFIEWVISGNRANETPKAIYSAPFVTTQTVLTSDLQNGLVKNVILDPASGAAKITQTGGLQYYVEDITDAQALEEQIGSEQPDVVVIQGTVAPPAAKDIQPSFTNDVVNGRVDSVVMNVKDQTMEVTLQPVDGKAQQYTVAYTDPAATTAFLDQNNVPYDATSPKSAWWTSALFTILPILLIIGFWFFMMNQMQGGGSKVMSFGKSSAKRVSVDSPKVTFKDVAGVDEAVEELHEIKEFLENPKKFQQLGARIPKGVLLYGPPGTGKTLLARAVAGEAGVPFFSISGSDFVEMFVGVGASRVRDLFEQAKQNAPCIIFVDEIDAVGRHRGAGMGGGHDEREQTLNQLLVEMDGFEMKDNVILIAATNRPDILDPALLRPGRFDRQIVVDRPDRPGRKQILEVHSRGKPIAKDIDLDALAAQTPGFTGADLANLVNEAALLAARHGKKLIGMTRARRGHHARPRRAREEDAHHQREGEGDHRLPRDGPRAGRPLPRATDPVHKISVVSRGQALGYTISLPTEDKFLTTKEELMDKLAMTLGGRAAEEIVFDEITTGAANDIEKATATAKQMIMRYGMSEELGPRTLGPRPVDAVPGPRVPAAGRLLRGGRPQIDDEIRRIIEEAHQRAKDLLAEKRELLDASARSSSRARPSRRPSSRRWSTACPRTRSSASATRRRRAAAGRAAASREKRQRAKQPPVPKPAHVNPVNPEAT